MSLISSVHRKWYLAQFSFLTLDLQKPKLSNSLDKLNPIVWSDAPKFIFYRNTETELKVFTSSKNTNKLK